MELWEGGNWVARGGTVTWNMISSFLVFFAAPPPPRRLGSWNQDD